MNLLLRTRGCLKESNAEMQPRLRNELEFLRDIYPYFVFSKWWLQPFTLEVYLSPIFNPQDSSVTAPELYALGLATQSDPLSLSVSIPNLSDGILASYSQVFDPGQLTGAGGGWGWEFKEEIANANSEFLQKGELF